jgi:D-alanine-D-alanine ligase-like ATP-grasp enzyme
MPLLIEEFHDGRHIHAVLTGNRVLDVQPLVERRKDEAGVEELVVAQLDIDDAGRIRDLAQRAFRAMSLRDFGMVDFVLTRTGEAYVIDVRPAPELGAGMPAREVGNLSDVGFEGVLDKAVQAVVARAKISLTIERPAPPPAPDLPPPPPETEPAAEDPRTDA